MDDTAQQAITAALSGDWPKARALNEEILKNGPDDVDALVRLAKADTELGDYAKAKVILEKVIKLDPINSIAIKAIARIKSTKKAGEVTHTKADSQMLLEEPGKTKLAELTHLGDPDIILQLDPGDEVKLISGGHTISVNTLNDKHIGRIPDNLGFKLKSFISKGFTYQALVKSVSRESVKIFIRETTKPPKFEKITSFPIERQEISDEEEESNIS